MKWFDNFIRRAYMRAREREELLPVASSSRGNKLSSKTRVASNFDDTNVYNFTIYGANGGHIVEVMRYDEKNDNERANRYIIADNESLTDSIGRIVTMEFLR